VGIDAFVSDDIPPHARIEPPDNGSGSTRTGGEFPDAGVVRNNVDTDLIGATLDFQGSSRIREHS
jgi:hypothetical protein